MSLNTNINVVDALCQPCFDFMNLQLTTVFVGNDAMEHLSLFSWFVGGFLDHMLRSTNSLQVPAVLLSVSHISS